MSATVGGNEAAHQEVELDPERDYTGHAELTELAPGTSYEIRACFALSRGVLRWRQQADEREGRVTTFPEPESDGAFRFWLGSCNLSTVALTNVGGLAAGALGTLATSQALERKATSWVWPPQAWLRRLLDPLRRLARKVNSWLFLGITLLTRYQQPAPLLPSPFAGLAAQSHSEGPDRPAFMIHAGDQIYYDVPFPDRAPDLTEYRRAYCQAWFEDSSLRELLARVPHYMMLDDHDIVDAFGTRPNDSGPDYLTPARQAYLEYVHGRHPAGKEGLFYSFQHGRTHFFVLDARTERNPANRQMIGPTQMEALKSWLECHSRELKFVVSSVPFVAEVVSKEERNDKWCGCLFRGQRDELLAFLHENEIGPLVFLVGDMHCAYHATLRLGSPARRVTIHELAGGPVSQLDFSSRADFSDYVRCEVPGANLAYEVVLRSFYGGATNVMEIEVEDGASPRVRWEVSRTSARAKPKKPLKRPRTEPRPLVGWIRF